MAAVPTTTPAVKSTVSVDALYGQYILLTYIILCYRGDPNYSYFSLINICVWGGH